MGGSRELRNTVNASIQVSAVTEVEGKSEVSGGTGDGSLQKSESGEGGKKVDANAGGDEVARHVPALSPPELIGLSWYDPRARTGIGLGNRIGRRGIMQPSKVVQALKVLQEEGREDLLKDGVLEQAWVGLRRTKRSSAEGVTAAILVCASPEQSPKKFKKFKSKSVSGRKVSVFPECTVELVGESSVDLPVVHPVRRGGARFARRSGASFRQRVATVGRGTMPVGAVADAGQAGASSVGAHAFKRRRASRKCTQQAPSAVESDAERVELVLDERTFGGATNMAVPSESSEFLTVEVDRQQLSGGDDPATFPDMEVVVIDSDEERDEGKTADREAGRRVDFASASFRGTGGRMIQWVPRVTSPMLRRVQEWEVDNQSVFRAGEQVEFVDDNGVVLRGTICGTAMENGRPGTAQIRLDFWQPSQGAYRPGCDSPQVFGGHEVFTANQQLGRPSGLQQVPVGVRAPSGHRDEGRVKPRAVHLTLREAAVRGSGSLDLNFGFIGSISASQGASSRLEIGEESLDYDEEDLVHGMQSIATVEKSKTGRRTVQDDRLSCRQREMAGNLLRGEVYGYEAGMVGVGFGGNAVEVQGKDNVDVAIQVSVGDGAETGKLESSQGVADAVTEGAAVGLFIGGSGQEAEIGVALGAKFAGPFEFCLQGGEGWQSRLQKTGFCNARSGLTASSRSASGKCQRGFEDVDCFFAGV
ncbi:hypothetical protein NDU88_005269 [Pleurodeles waltl]|uniref:Uncharacterized protein n=1 Tax=Pleurodeles waltl TaxID=8319 RepID=A0AAV7WXS3_PLEWA|nr:hypothetical protein NDU88_005269 [Pleurodeles waltl]